MILKVPESNGGSSGGTNGEEAEIGMWQRGQIMLQKDAWSTEVMMRMGFCRKHHQRRGGVLGEGSQDRLQRAG